MATDDSNADRPAGGGLAVISPHLDDAVFSCGEIIAAHPGCTVITVFGGSPVEAATCVTDWDRQCGFANAADAMATRRQEDTDALAILDARPLILDFCDSQYNATPTQQQVAAALEAALHELRPALVLYPLGLFHSDHVLVHQACAEALAGMAVATLAYEDALYRAMPGLLQQRLAGFAESGLQATPAPQPRPAPAPAADEGRPSFSARKQRAIAAYLSQLRAFGEGGYSDTGEPERCWRLESVPAREASSPPKEPVDD